jgi:hypothetical protein
MNRNQVLQVSNELKTFACFKFSCFSCLIATKINSRAVVHFNFLELNAEIQIADRRSSKINGRMTVTAHIDSMLALCVQMMV